MKIFSFNNLSLTNSINNFTQGVYEMNGNFSLEMALVIENSKFKFYLSRHFIVLKRTLTSSHFMVIRTF